MKIDEIIGLIMLTIALTSLIVLLFMVCIPLAKIEQKERKTKTKLYITLTNYLENKVNIEIEKRKTKDDTNESKKGN